MTLQIEVGADNLTVERLVRPREEYRRAVRRLADRAGRRF
jgi:hypothetical protein